MPDAGMVSAPSTGAAVADSGAAAAPSTVDYSKTSDDQIIDGALAQSNDAVSTPDPGAADQANTVDAGTEGQPKVEAQPSTQEPPDKPELEVQIPENLKAVFKQFPDLRNEFFAAKAFREQFQTVAEAREYRTLFPSLDEAKAAVVSRDDLAALDDMFLSGDPGRQAEYIKTIHGENPEAFRSLAKVFPDVLAELDPESYAQDTKDRFSITLNSVLRTANARGDENVKNAVAHLAHVLGLDVGAQRQPDPRDAEYTRREQAQKEREQTFQKQQFQSFHSSVGSHIGEKVGEAITAKLNEVLKQTQYKPTPDARQELENKIFTKIDATIKADRALTANLRKAFNAARQAGYGEGEREKCGQLIINRSNQLLAKAAAEVVTHWTEKVLQLSKEQNQVANAAAGRKDISGAPPSGNQGPARIPTSKQIDYSKMDDEAIVNAALGKREFALRK